MSRRANAEGERRPPVTATPRWRRARRLVASALRVCLIFVLILMLFERFLVFPAPHGGDWRPTRLVYEDAWFTSADGTKLHGWFFEHPAASQVVLYAHGNGENVA